jgi:hypothetical protein
MPAVGLRSVPFDVGAAYSSGGGLRHGRYVNMYSLSSVKYCRLITVPFIAGLLWVMVPWIMGLMADGLLRPLRRPLGLIKATRPKWMRK